MLQLIVMAVLVGGVVAGGFLVLREKFKADRRLRDAISVIPAGLGFYDSQDRLYLWNKTYEEVSGSRGEPLRAGVRFRELIETDLKNNHYAEAVGREKAWLDERVTLRALASGSLEQDLGGGRWLRVEDRRSSDGGIVSICTDITELKLRESSFKILFDSNPVPMWLWEGGRSLKILQMNAAALQHLGYTDDEVAKLTVFDVLSVNDWPALHEMIRTGIAQSYDAERIWSPRRKDGVHRRAMPYIQMLPDPLGKPRFVGAIVDVTDRMDAEDALRRSTETLAAAKEEAEAANRVKSEFLATMSHELRTPLNGVLGMADLLARAELGPKEREMVEIVRASGATLERLLSDILDIVSVETGCLSVDAQPFDLGDAVTAVAGLFEPSARDKGLTLRVEIADEAAAMFRGDAVRVKQILGALVSNAVKFTDRGGVSVAASATEAGVRLQVRDTGVGFDPEDAQRIFGRFEQADGSITRRHGGSGLGLSIARDLVALMGGTIEAQSARGDGATFTVDLPLARVDTVEMSAREGESADSDRPLRILLADDHPTNRKVVELMLAAAEAELVSVENGLEALEAYQATPFDVVLMDMQMPVMDGLTAIRRIRDYERDTSLAPAPVIMLTANALPEHVRAAAEAGADRHLAKPITAQTLLGAISAVLDQTGDRRAA
ncbi:MAG TPA: ATP-binding protein [Caulobacteraceae bacterium]|jgi:PAS domain S-box-containing protein|nr:ATP-binding protein [Caulobacteraceae bacterium]